MSRDKKRCLVPQCTNDSHCAPNKYFVRFPTNTKLRQKWFESINVDAKVTHHAKIYICEDHFSLEDDAENWMYFITIGSNIRLKKNVVPHRNIHQLDKDISVSVSQISPSQKKRKQVNIEKFRELMFDDEQPSCSSTTSQSSQTSLPSPNKHNVFATFTSSLQSEKLNEDTSKRRLLSEDYDTNNQKRKKNDIDREADVSERLQYIKTGAFEEIMIKQEIDYNEEYSQENRSNKSDIDREADATDRLQHIKTEAFEEIMIKEEEIGDNSEYLQEYDHFLSEIKVEEDHEKKLIIPDELS